MMRQKAPFPPTLTSINRLCFVIANKKNVLHAFDYCYYSFNGFSLIYDFEAVLLCVGETEGVRRGKKFDKLMTVSSVPPNHN